MSFLFTLPPYRLIHRLDRNVSGVMAVARSAHAAAWMAACFRDKAAQVWWQGVS